MRELWLKFVRQKVGATKDLENSNVEQKSSQNSYNNELFGGFNPPEPCNKAANLVSSAEWAYC